MLTLKLATEIVQLIDLRSFKWACELELPMEFLEKRLEWGQTRKKTAASCEIVTAWNAILIRVH